VRPLERHHNADLSALSTFRLPATARELVFLDGEDQLAGLQTNDTLLVLGGGSNTVFLRDWPGIVLVNRLRGISVKTLSPDRSLVRVAAGENWHKLVRWCMDHQLYGLENLILIPGSAGAAPIQNIGAYGVELSDILESVTVWDWQTRQQSELSTAECGFCYRSSRFKHEDRDRFLITAITLRLNHRFSPTTDYESLSRALERRESGKTPSARQVAAAVMRIRRHRLPDPARIANVGSFFKNPIVGAAKAEKLSQDFPDLPQWRLEDGRVKLAAGWMLEQCGWKGKSVGQAAVYERHALVLINRGKASGADLQRLIDQMTSSVEDRFGIRIEPEPRLIGHGG
jgi:UDP-N-acetylmuramate dehydrogenase